MSARIGPLTALQPPSPKGAPPVSACALEGSPWSARPCTHSHPHRLSPDTAPTSLVCCHPVFPPTPSLLDWNFPSVGPPFPSGLQAVVPVVLPMPESESLFLMPPSLLPPQSPHNLATLSRQGTHARLGLEIPKTYRSETGQCKQTESRA